MTAIPPLRARVPGLPALPESHRVPGALVFIYGDAGSSATLVQVDDDGAIVREHDDLSEGWHPWGRLTIEPAPEAVEYAAAMLAKEGSR